VTVPAVSEMLCDKSISYSRILDGHDIGLWSIESPGRVENMAEVAYLLQAFIILFSLLAGGFSLSSAIGRTIPLWPPWGPSNPVAPPLAIRLS
jgi:hypothetical protein